MSAESAQWIALVRESMRQEKYIWARMESHFLNERLDLHRLLAQDISRDPITQHLFLGSKAREALLGLCNISIDNPYGAQIKLLESLEAERTRGNFHRGLPSIRPRSLTPYTSFIPAVPSLKSYRARRHSEASFNTIRRMG
jgi:hypothetical protein